MLNRKHLHRVAVHHSELDPVELAALEYSLRPDVLSLAVVVVAVAVAVAVVLAVAVPMFHHLHYTKHVNNIQMEIDRHHCHNEDFADNRLLVVLFGLVLVLVNKHVDKCKLIHKIRVYYRGYSINLYKYSIK